MIPPLLHAARIGELREQVLRASDAHRLVVQLEVTHRVLAKLPPLPEGVALPGTDLVEALSEWGLRGDDTQQSRVELFARALESLRPRSDADALQAELDGLLAEQQEAMFLPESRPTIAHLKVLAAERQALGERIGPARQQLSVIEGIDWSAASSEGLEPVFEVVFGKQAPPLNDLDEARRTLEDRALGLRETLASDEATASRLDAEMAALTG